MAGGEVVDRRQFITRSLSALSGLLIFPKVINQEAKVANDKSLYGAECTCGFCISEETEELVNEAATKHLDKFKYNGLHTMGQRYKIIGVIKMNGAAN